MNKLFIVMMLFSAGFAQVKLEFRAVVANGTNGVDGLQGPASIVISGDNKSVYVVSNSGSAVVVFDRDTYPKAHVLKMALMGLMDYSMQVL
jgi:hypothetical protein